jgi:pyruvate dehydrogenase E2 component (dihydrolipoamide acetyltransferase)
MTSAKVTRWYKTEGEAILTGDILCELDTEIAVIDYRAQDDGVLALITAASGEDVAEGKVTNKETIYI